MLLIAHLVNMGLALLWIVILRALFGLTITEAILFTLVMQMATLSGTVGVCYSMMYAHFHRLYPKAKVVWGMYEV